ncbi:hypothetical protein SEPCBS119000_006722 [Sporothrix epigloea]|uniref:Uncharacterized protein n=1 Tax=Sporothrix epigloea TaxID=1892477 RepID=A0ABP0E6G6_9PEZI
MHEERQSWRQEREARANIASAIHVAAAITTAPVDMAAAAPVVADQAETAAATAATMAAPAMAPMTVAHGKAVMAVIPASETIATPITLCTEKAATSAILPSEPTATTDTFFGTTLVVKRKEDKGNRDDNTVARGTHGSDGYARSDSNSANAHTSASRKQLSYRPFPNIKLPAPVGAGMIHRHRRKNSHDDADTSNHIAHCGALRNNGCSPYTTYTTYTTPKPTVKNAGLASTPITTVRLKRVGGFGPIPDLPLTHRYMWCAAPSRPRSARNVYAAQILKRKNVVAITSDTADTQEKLVG